MGRQPVLWQMRSHWSSSFAEHPVWQEQPLRCGCVAGSSFLAEVYAWLPKREVCLAKTLQPIIVYSDASWDEDGKVPPRLGWVDLVPGGQTLAGTMVLTSELVQRWTPRKQQIFAAETLAGLVIPMPDPDTFSSRDVVWFVDNEAACSTLIRGVCGPEDVAEIACITHMKLHKLSCRVWWEWIDSKSNPADGLSRDGLQDAWTKTQGWSPQEFEVPREAFMEASSYFSETLGS